MSQDTESEPHYMQKPPELSDLEWITLKTDIDSKSLKLQETAGAKFMRKFKENPLVPIGCGLTATALFMGLYSFNKDNNRTSQKMMRFRIAAQGFTVVALMFGVVKGTMMK